MMCQSCGDNESQMVCSKCNRAICAECMDLLGCHQCGAILCNDCAEESPYCGDGVCQTDSEE